MQRNDWRDALDDEEVGIVGACLSAASDGPFFPDWEFSTLFGFERTELRSAADLWPAKADLEDEYGAVSSSMNNLLGYPHGIRGKVWDEWIPVSRDRLDVLYNDIRESSGANDRARQFLAAELAAFERFDTDALVRKACLVRDVVGSAERLGAVIPSSIAAFMAGQSFSEEAQSFCTYLGRGALSLRELEDRLESLIEAARALPDVDPTEARYDDPDGLKASCIAVAARVGAVARDHAFYEVPIEGGEPAVGDLRDDLADIYSDLRRDMNIATQHHIDGVWSFRFSFETHWRRHAEDALRALRSL